MINRSIKTFLFTFLLLIGSASAEIITRAALDVGSGETKITIADVNTETNKIEKIWLQTIEVVELKKDLSASPDGRLSKKIEDRLIEALAKFKEISSQYEPKQWFGIGTSVFRKASNGQEVLDRVRDELGINIQLVPQTEEAEIGFMTAVAASGLESYEVMSWDSGSGSFQITTEAGDELDMYGAEIAYVHALKALYDIRGIPFNPDVLPEQASFFEALQVMTSIKEQLPEIPFWMFLENKQLIAIGGETSIFSLAKIASKETTPYISKEQVGDALFNMLDTDPLHANEEKRWPGGKKDVEVAVSLMLLYSVMEHCGFNTVAYYQTNGTCEGLLVMPRYWYEVQPANSNEEQEIVSKGGDFFPAILEWLANGIIAAGSTPVYVVNK